MSDMSVATWFKVVIWSPSGSGFTPSPKV